MYFDFDDRYDDIEPVGSAINRRDGVAMAVVVHLAIIAAIMFAPQYLPQKTESPQQMPSPREDAPRTASWLERRG